jgi:UDP-2-acetamido-3-amino-2,3-dideoxy-glucuronate N-acetyltransferase
VVGPAIHPDANVDASCRVWGNAIIRSGASVGAHTIVGSGAYIDTDVSIGSNCKIQNGAQVFFPAVVENGVFIGPLVILTNDKYPRAVNSNETLKGANDWQNVGVTIKSGASIGAGAVCVAPITIGRWAMVAAGAIAIRNILDFELVAGNPAEHVGWVGRSGKRLVEIEDNVWACSLTDEIYFLDSSGKLTLREKCD